MNISSYPPKAILSAKLTAPQALHILHNKAVYQALYNEGSFLSFGIEKAQMAEYYKDILFTEKHDKTLLSLGLGIGVKSGDLKVWNQDFKNNPVVMVSKIANGQITPLDHITAIEIDKSKVDQLQKSLNNAINSNATQKVIDDLTYELTMASGGEQTKVSIDAFISKPENFPSAISVDRLLFDNMIPRHNKVINAQNPFDKNGLKVVNKITVEEYIHHNTIVCGHPTAQLHMHNSPLSEPNIIANEHQLPYLAYNVIGTDEFIFQDARSNAYIQGPASALSEIHAAWEPIPEDPSDIEIELGRKTPALQYSPMPTIITPDSARYFKPSYGSRNI